MFIVKMFSAINFLKGVMKMPVKIGNSYVSEAAYEYAKSQTDENATLKSLAEKFPNLKFSISTAPFSGNGLHNVAIAQNILREMENNPDKKLEYEALLYDVASLPPPKNLNVKSQGVIIDKNGGMSMWSIGESGREKIPLNRDDKQSWWKKLIEKLQKNNDNEKANGKVAFNADKRARQLAAATSKNDVRAIMNLLQMDLKQCEDGVKNSMCDVEEVEKVRKMIENAEKRLNEVDENSDEKFSVDVLI